LIWKAWLEQHRAAIAPVKLLQLLLLPRLLLRLPLLLPRKHQKHQRFQKRRSNLILICQALMHSLLKTPDFLPAFLTLGQHRPRPHPRLLRMKRMKVMMVMMVKVREKGKAMAAAVAEKVMGVMVAMAVVMVEATAAVVVTVVAAAEMEVAAVKNAAASLSLNCIPTRLRQNRAK
jgi:hypothetical protein